jgi:hypothetical protein
MVDIVMGYLLSEVFNVIFWIKTQISRTNKETAIPINKYK